MCVLFSLLKEIESVAAQFGVSQITAPPLERKRYNIAPGDRAAVLTSEKADTLQWFEFGLLPALYSESAIGINLVNARSETLHDTSAFKDLITRKRCLIFADGYYEWEKQGKEKMPCRIVRPDHRVFAIAGIYDQFTHPTTGRLHQSFSIITRPAVEFIAVLHERMPFILPEKKALDWLHVGLYAQLLKNTHLDFQPEWYHVSNKVNKSSYEGPDSIQPLANTGFLF